MDFDGTVSYLALIHSTKRKLEPPTTRRKRILEILSSYTFKLYYIEGKGMTLNDFFVKNNVDNSDPGEIVPIFSSIYKLPFEKGPKTIASGVKYPKVHSFDDSLNPNLNLENKANLK